MSFFRGCALQRLSEAKAIRDIYMNDEIFNNRSLPRYYHGTYQSLVPLILDSMVIKWAKALYPGAWFATGTLRTIYDSIYVLI
jgi:Zn/Cd-binding protein ZinT